MTYLEIARQVVKDQSPVDWLAAWRDVAALTHGIRVDAPRLPAIMDAIGQCDRAFANGDYTAFLLAREGVKRACQGKIVHG